MEKDNLPTRAQSLIFRGKASILQLKRGVKNLLDSDLRQFQIDHEPTKLPVLAESITPLWTEKAAGEQFLQAGKIQMTRVMMANGTPPRLYPINVRTCVEEAPGSI